MSEYRSLELIDRKHNNEQKMASIVQRLGQRFVVPLMRVRFPLLAPEKHQHIRWCFSFVRRTLING